MNTLCDEARHRMGVAEGAVASIWFLDQFSFKKLDMSHKSPFKRHRFPRTRFGQIIAIGL